MKERFEKMKKKKKRKNEIKIKLERDEKAVKRERTKY